MLTRIRGETPHTVGVFSIVEDVRVLVDSDVEGLPSCALSRSQVHDALVVAKEKAEDFIAAIEGDLDALEH